MIRQILDTLPSQDRQALMHAFNEIFCFIHDLPNGHFIGVHIQNTEGMEIKESNGIWFYGKYQPNKEA